MAEFDDTVLDRTYDGSQVVLRRSARRRKTVAATRESGQLVVSVPARMSRREAEGWVDKLLKQMRDKQDAQRGADSKHVAASDEALMARSVQLVDRYLGGKLYPVSVRWSAQQRRVWGNCRPDEKTIRLNVALKKMPEWVIDYVLVHELAHLLEASHNKRFWALCANYPKAERARGYLEGVSAAEALGLQGADPGIEY